MDKLYIKSCNFINPNVMRHPMTIVSANIKRHKNEQKANASKKQKRSNATHKSTHGYTTFFSSANTKFIIQ